MQTQQRQNNFSGVLLVLFVAWLLFGNGMQVVLLLTQQAQTRLAQQQQPLIITMPTAQVAAPAPPAAIQPQPLAPGQLAPLTLDAQPAPAVADVPAPQPEPAAPVVADQPAPPVAQAPEPAPQPQPTIEVAGKPIVAAAQPVDPDLIVKRNGAYDWAAMAATARPQCVSGCDSDIGKLMQEQLNKP